MYDSSVRDGEAEPRYRILCGGMARQAKADKSRVATDAAAQRSRVSLGASGGKPMPLGKMCNIVLFLPQKKYPPRWTSWDQSGGCFSSSSIRTSCCSASDQLTVAPTAAPAPAALLSASYFTPRFLRGVPRQSRHRPPCETKSSPLELSRSADVGLADASISISMKPGKRLLPSRSICSPLAETDVSTSVKFQRRQYLSPRRETASA